RVDGAINSVGGRGNANVNGWRGRHDTVAALGAAASQRQTGQSHRKQTILNHDQSSLNQSSWNLQPGNPLPGKLCRRYALPLRLIPNSRAARRPICYSNQQVTNVPESKALVRAGWGFGGCQPCRVRK